MREHRFKTSGFYLIISLTTINGLMDVTSIFEDCWSMFMVNVNVLLPLADDDDGYDTAVYTYFPYDEMHCRTVVPERIFHSGVENLSSNPIEWFPDKLSDMHGCDFKIAFTDYYPMIILSENSSGHMIVGGIEGELLETLAKLLHFTPKYIKFPRDYGSNFIAVQWVGHIQGQLIVSVKS